MAQRPGQSVFHLGPQRDISIFEGLDIRFAGPEARLYREGLEHYGGVFRRASRRK